MKFFEVYKVLLKHFGKQSWWPGDTRLEICISAILTQNTNWKNVEKSLDNFKKLNLLPRTEGNYLDYAIKIYNLKDEKLEEVIKPSGFYKNKAKTIKNFLKFLIENEGFEELEKLSDSILREKLYKIKGIGNETVDAIMLYAFDRLSFVIDNYTIRMLYRHGIKLRNYLEYKRLFETNLPKDLEVYKEFHALIVELGKRFCKKKQAFCDKCPLGSKINIFHYKPLQPPLHTF